MTRREFFLLLSRSGLLVAGSGAGWLDTAWGAPDAETAPSMDCAINPIKPYLKSHPFPWPTPPPRAKQSFDLLNWNAPAGGVGMALNQPSGTLTIEPAILGDQMTYVVQRHTPNDALTTRFQCANDDWHTPRAWTVEQHPTMSPPFPLSTTLTGSFQDGKLVSGRTPDLQTEIPVTTLAALTGSIPVLENAAKSGSSFYALTESGVVIGPLQASARPPLTDTNGTPLMQVVALWGPRTVPLHVVYDSAGAITQTGFLMSAIRSTLS